MRQITLLLAFVVCALSSGQYVKYSTNITYMNWRVKIEQTNWIEDVQAAAQAQMHIATNEGGYELFGRSWELWLHDVAKEYDRL